MNAGHEEMTTADDTHATTMTFSLLVIYMFTSPSHSKCSQVAICSISTIMYISLPKCQFVMALLYLYIGEVNVKVAVVVLIFFLHLKHIPLLSLNTHY